MRAGRFVVGPDAILIHRLYIAPERRGRGIGTAVLRDVIMWAKSATFSIRLSVLSTSPAARRLYEREGFVLETKTPDRLHLILRPRAE
jgi:GNAT superfamily N-acetyltransferase